MWFSLFTVVLVLTITFYQGLQGTFTALINCLLTVLAAALAFGYFENLYFWQLAAPLPEHGRAVALMGIFLVTLLILRTIADALITGNVQLPKYADSVGAGIFGFISAMLIVGMLTISMQMLPFDTELLGFARYAVQDSSGASLTPEAEEGEDHRGYRAKLDWSQVRHARRSLWFSPDGFTAHLMTHLSSYALHGKTSLATVYPDLLGTLHNARAGHWRESLDVAPADALTVKGYWDLPDKMLYRREPAGDAKPARRSKEVRLERVDESPPIGMKRIVVRVTVGRDARDPDGEHRFVVEQFRLVGRQGERGAIREFFPVGMNFDGSARWVTVHRGEGFSSKAATMTRDLIFEIPDSPDFEPWFVEYKLNARAELRASMDQSKEPPAPLAPEGGDQAKSAADADKGKKKDARRGRTDARKSGQDRVSGLGPARQDTTFSDELPFTLANYGGTDVDVAGGKLRGGRLWASLGGDWKPKKGNKPAFSKLEVGDDKRLLQLSVEKLQPESWLGNIYGGIIDTISDFYLIDEEGREYMPVGSYAMALDPGGDRTFEIIYLDETARGFARLPKFQKINPRDLKGKYALFYLFHLPPGCRPEKLHTGRKDVDLRDLNLVAPQ